MITYDEYVKACQVVEQFEDEEYYRNLHKEERADREYRRKIALSLGYSNLRAYMTEERARDQRLDCMSERG